MMKFSKMKLLRGNIILCKVPMPSEELRKFKLRPGLVVSKDLNNKRLHECLKDALALI